MADCCQAQEGVTPGGTPYAVHEDTCSALYEILAMDVDNTSNAIEVDLLQGDAELLLQALREAFNPHREVGTIQQEDVLWFLDCFITLKNNRVLAERARNTLRMVLGDDSVTS